MKSRIFGFASSLIFTTAAYFIIALNSEVLHLSPSVAILFILLLAVFQAMVQSVFFLHVLSEKGPPWNLVIFMFTISVVIIIIAFSIWIMDQLNYHMMAM